MNFSSPVDMEKVFFHSSSSSPGLSKKIAQAADRSFPDESVEKPIRFIKLELFD